MDMIPKKYKITLTEENIGGIQWQSLLLRIACMNVKMMIPTLSQLVEVGKKAPIQVRSSSEVCPLHTTPVLQC